MAYKRARTEFPESHRRPTGWDASDADGLGTFCDSSQFSDAASRKRSRLLSTPVACKRVYFTGPVRYLTGMLRKNLRVMSATKGTFGAGEVVRGHISI